MLLFALNLLIPKKIATRDKNEYFEDYNIDLHMTTSFWSSSTYPRHPAWKAATVPSGLLATNGGQLGWQPIKAPPVGRRRGQVARHLPKELWRVRKQKTPSFTEIFVRTIAVGNGFVIGWLGQYMTITCRRWRPLWEHGRHNGHAVSWHVWRILSFLAQWPYFPYQWNNLVFFFQMKFGHYVIAQIYLVFLKGASA